MDGGVTFQILDNKISYLMMSSGGCEVMESSPVATPPPLPHMREMFITNKKSNKQVTLWDSVELLFVPKALPDRLLYTSLISFLQSVHSNGFHLICCLFLLTCCNWIVQVCGSLWISDINSVTSVFDWLSCVCAPFSLVGRHHETGCYFCLKMSVCAVCIKSCGGEIR